MTNDDNDPGQSESEASANLCAINQFNEAPKPWRWDGDDNDNDDDDHDDNNDNVSSIY